MTTTKPKFFLPGDKVKIKGETGIFIIQTWSDEHTEVFESDDGEDDDFSEESETPYKQDLETRDGTDYKHWSYSTTVSAWHDYKDITFIEAGWMRKMICK